MRDIITYTLTVLLQLAFCLGVLAQETSAKPMAKLLVTFTDKAQTPYSVHQPWEFLSARAIERRKRYGIAINESDLPVDPAYVEQVLAACEGNLHLKSKWLNAAVVISYDSLMGPVSKLPFVTSVTRLGKHKPYIQGEGPEELKPSKDSTYNTYYGMGSAQISMTAGHVLHQMGFAGEGVYVHVQDGGFQSIEKMNVFSPLREAQRLFHGRDFVGRDNKIDESSTHGTNVLSVMASFSPYYFIGTAPEATYICSITEDTKSETWTEELNWVAGAEYADSIGADVINSSLGYTTFNDKEQNWDYAAMNGRTTYASRGADIAHTKGLVVVNSAGNEGSGNWRYIGSPADAENVFSIGAVDIRADKARFSSFGPSSDERIKPNVSAMGQGIIVASSREQGLNYSNGTSFSSPLVAGLVASLWEAFPERSNDEIKAAIERTASQAKQPDVQLGYGIPDMYDAFRLLNDRYVLISPRNAEQIVTYEKPVAVLPGKVFQKGALLILKDMQGRELHRQALAPFSEYIGSQLPLKTGNSKPPYLLQVIGL